MKQVVLLFVFVFGTVANYAQPSFIPNLGQWEQDFQYKMEYSGGAIFFEPGSVTFSILSKNDLHELHDYELYHRQDNARYAPDFFSGMPAVNGHAYKMTFEGANVAQLVPESKKHTYHNYYIGNKPEHWKSEVPLYAGLTYRELYKGINLKYYQQEGRLKYDIDVAANADPAQVKIRYEGVRPSLDKNGKIIIDIGFETISELEPYCYQVINGIKTEVPSRYTLNDGILGFEFPAGYNKNYALTIDPVITFKSYSGSTAFTTGYTNAYDNDGRLCITGQVLGVGLPTTMGAFQVDYSDASGVDGDIGISVFNTNGTVQEYVTYLGGSLWDEPGAVRFNSNKELVIINDGTNSADFPVTTGCFDNSPPTASVYESAITKFNATGTALIGSTFFGNGNGGIDCLDFDADENIVLGGTANSSLPYTFPAGAYQTTATETDNILIKLNPTLTEMVAGTFFGGPNEDFMTDMVYNKVTNEIITISIGFGMGGSLPATDGAYSATGNNYLCRFNTGLGNLLTVARENASDGMLDFDGTGNIYISGKGEPAISAGVYSHANGEGFVKKIRSDLSEELLATQIGGEWIGAPVNMQVSSCGYIFLYSQIEDPSVFLAEFDTDADFTDDAWSTEFASYYYQVLEPDFANLFFATTLGSAEMDHKHSLAKNASGKGSAQYWGVCTENAEWWQTPGCARPIGPDPGLFDMAGMKFDLELPVGNDGSATISLMPGDTICLGDTVFLATPGSTTATIYWNLGDGSESSEATVAHVYDLTGTYTVVLQVVDPESCISELTDSVTIYVAAPEVITVSPQDTVICDAQTPIQISVSGGKSYSWTPPTAVDDPTAANVTLNGNGTHSLTVEVTHEAGCITHHNVNIAQYNVVANAGPDQLTIPGTKVRLDGSASIGEHIYWDADPTLDNINSLTPQVAPTVSTWYYINAESGEQCKARDSVLVTVAAISMPDAFSPNGDGLNDIFGLSATAPGVTKVNFQVFNRYGERVFSSFKVEDGWDGTYRNKFCDAGVYMYTLIAYIGDGVYKLKGDVTLVR